MSKLLSVVPSPSSSALAMCAAPPPSGATTQTHDKINALVQLATATTASATTSTGSARPPGR